MHSPRASRLLSISLAGVLSIPIARVSAQAVPPDPTASLLSEIIRINTSNPPGRTQALADLLGARFRAAGFTVEVFPTPDSAKVHFIARLKGDGSKRPILLAAHADVVGVEREKWSLDPFGGIVRDGHVYGRGAIDFKGGMAVFAMAALRLAERKVPLARDVIFMAEADEEAAPMNASWLAKDHWASMDAEFVLNEGGWIIKGDDDRVRYVSISTADKSVATIVLTATGTSTHSSMPLPDNPIAALASALARITAYETPVQLTTESRQFFRTLATTSTGDTSRWFRALVDGTPAEVRAADSLISRDPLLHAIMRNTIAPVLISGGFRSNVIPGSAQATLNLRLIPGTDPQSMVALMQRLVNDPRVAVTMGATSPVAGSTPSSVETELYQALALEANVQWPSAEVTPYLFQAGTDAGAWRSRGIPVYGIYPYPITNDELRRMHGNDERVSIASLQQGTDMIYRTLASVAGKGSRGRRASARKPSR
ncbi:MAG: M20/M25/M40 family metallo-hydrolase [Gemmatimonadaceae bacterium]|nr:M20/M25/M40 family metallo-hydrolase [Gemmatimonadaceae bacterium]